MNRLNLIQKQIHTKQVLYSVAVGQKKQGQSYIYRHPLSVNSLLPHQIDVKSLAEWWDQLVDKYRNNKLINDWTFIECDTISKTIGSWIASNSHSKIYLYMANCPQWTILDIAALNYGIITIPFYDTLGQQALQHIMKLTEGTLIVTTTSLCPKLLTIFNQVKSSIRDILVIDAASSNLSSNFQPIGCKVSYYEQILKHQNIIQRPFKQLDSHLTYIFTSGTTGIPKGVIITHVNLMVQAIGMSYTYPFLQTDVYMSYLPIAHILERMSIWNCYYFGNNIRYSQHAISEITKDLSNIKPTIFHVVPRLLNKLYASVQPIYQANSNAANIRDIFGGRVNKMLCGSAPISPEILYFFKGVLQCQIYEAYGQTQTTDTSYGHVGGPHPAMEIKLIDVPQMQYFTTSNPPKGEVCVRSKAVFIGYYKNQQNTKQVLDSEGWNHTGDVGEILPNGALKIIDRRKNIYKLSQGEYVAPEKIQNICLRCKCVAECFLYGNPQKDYSIAIIHPNLQQLVHLAKQLHIQSTNIKELCQNKLISQYVLKEVITQCRKDRLLSFQIPRKIQLWPQSFGNLGIFTNTMKLQRHIAKKVFISSITKLYQ